MTDDQQGTTIVTGCSSGIGESICRYLLEEGVNVSGVSRRLPGSNIINNPGFYHHQWDLEDLAGIKSLVARIVDDRGPVDALVCNAGRGRFGSIEEFSVKQITSLINLNLISQIVLAREVVPLMKKRRRGRIIFIGSQSAINGGRRGSVYSASKAGLRGFAMALRQECSRSNISVTVVNPGMTETSFFDDLHFEPGHEQEQHLLASDIAQTVLNVLDIRLGAVIDEVNLSPLKHVVNFKKQDEH